MEFDLKSIGSRVCFNLSNSVESFKKFVLKPVNLYKRSKRRKIEDSFEEDSDDEVNLNQKFLKPTCVQLTKLYIERQKQFRRDHMIPKNALMYYLDALNQQEDEVCDLVFIEKLLNDGVDINFVDEMNENVLFRAIKAENENLVKLLLKKDVDVKLVNKMSLNVFHVCSRNQKVNIIRALADKFTVGLEVYLEQKTTREQQTPLHFAAKEGSIAVADCLITVFQVNKEALDNKNRTPLFLAAEFNRKSMVKLLIDLKCCISFTNEKKHEMLNNNKGQNALYYITAKMPDIASAALDNLYEPNLYLRKDRHYLACLEPKVVKKTKKTKVTDDDEILPKSVLSAIVETENLDLVMHPTITCVIDVKWKAYARKQAWLDFILSLTYVFVWIAFALWEPYNTRHLYDFTRNEDRFRMALFVIGILLTFYLMAAEMREVHSDYIYQKKAIYLRQLELDEYKADMVDENSAEANFIRDEESLLKQFNNLTVLKDYVTDAWNLYDWVSIALLLCCIVTHVDDIQNHSEEKARLHIRLMSMTIIVISVRILKSSRIVVPKLGTLVMILFYSMSDMLIWFLFHIVIWLSFACSFWIIYGGLKFEKNVNEDNGGCVDVYDTEFNDANNCTVDSVPAFKNGFTFLAYALYVITFGGNFDEVSMDSIDDQMKIPLTGTYIAMTILVSANIFIALLSATFQRVYERAEANIIFERAAAIICFEKSMTYAQRRHHIRYLKKIGYPYIDDSYNEIITTIGDRIVGLEEDVKEQRDMLKKIDTKVDANNLLLSGQNGSAIKLVQEMDVNIKELRELLMNFIETSGRPAEEQKAESDESLFEKAPQFEYLKFDATSPH